MNQPKSNPESYPEKANHVRQRLGNLSSAQPEVMKSFMALHQAATSKGALDPKNKELIALAISVTSNCDDCISFHMRDALRQGASREEIMETLSVAVLMGGGPAAMYAAHALDALDQWQDELPGSP